MQKEQVLSERTEPSHADDENQKRLLEENGKSRFGSIDSGRYVDCSPDMMNKQRIGGSHGQMPLKDLKQHDTIIIGGAESIAPPKAKEQQNFSKVGVSNELQDLTMAVMMRGVREKYQNEMSFKRRTLSSDPVKQLRNQTNEAIRDQYMGKIHETNKGITITNENNDTVELKANSRFQNYANIFSNLLRVKNVQTQWPILSCIISFDSTRVITITRKSTFEYYVKMFCLQSYELTFEEKVGGDPSQYIKLKDIEQNPQGNKFALAYFDDGKFRIRTFGRESRTDEEIQKEEFDVNTAIGIDDHTMANDGFDDPYINVEFLDDAHLFVNLFYNKKSLHYHFIYEIENQRIKDELSVCHKIENTSYENFPQKCFYNKETEEVYAFYNEGQHFQVNAKNINDYRFDKISDRDLGQMYLFRDKALIVRSSSYILFFKQMQDDMTGQYSWKQYHELKIRGTIYYIKGNKRIQITTDEKIYFYLIDPETFEPILENTIWNYMKCNQMMFGQYVRYCITYKYNQMSFDVHQRKYHHALKAPVIKEDYDKSQGLEVQSMGCFIITKLDRIIVYDSETFQVKTVYKVPLLESTSREPNEIISIQTCENESYLAVISGKNLIKDEQFPNQLFVFKIEKDREAGSIAFDLINRVILKDIEIFSFVSMDFFFKIKEGQLEKDTIIFAKKDQIFELNFVTQKVQTIHIFENKFKRQPQFFKTNKDQKVILLASAEDCIYVNLKKTIEYEIEFDLDENFQISCIEEAIYDAQDKCFFIISNRLKGQLGLYLLKISEDDPKMFNYLIKWNTKLQLGNANVYIQRSGILNCKEIIVSYKQIYVNTFNVLVIDLSEAKCDSGHDVTHHGLNMIFRHESFQLWQQTVRSLLLTGRKDFLTINKQGISLLVLGDADKRVIQNGKGQTSVIHGLESFNYLSIDKRNFMTFECSTENTVISVQQEYMESSGGCEVYTTFEKIFSINVQEITLRQLLLFQSLYLCTTASKIVDLVNDQPDPRTFYNAYLELDGANMLSILSFDSRTMKYLLDDQFDDYFSSDFPLFYKNKIQKGPQLSYEVCQDQGRNTKYFYLSAIDNAINNNQVSAVSLIVRYCIRYQCNYPTSFLFLKNLPQIFQMGISVRELLDSDVFNYHFDFDQWPSVHTNDDQRLRAYSGSLFDLRSQYSKIFPEEEYAPINQEEQIEKKNRIMEFFEDDDDGKIFKINYKVNLVPQIGLHVVENTETGQNQFVHKSVSLMDLCENSDDIDIFLSNSIQEVIEFKWRRYAKSWHSIGCFFHMFYMGMLFAYNDFVYAENQLEGLGKHYSAEEQDHHDSGLHEAEGANYYSILLALGTVYPAIYDFVQMWRVGLKEYFQERWNYIDFIYIFSSIAQVVLHSLYRPFDTYCRATMTIVLFLGMGKTFFFLRIIEKFSPIVTMLSFVIVDLIPFMIFYSILCIMFGLQLGIMGLGNTRVEGNFRKTYATKEYDVVGDDGTYNTDYFGVVNSEYRQIPMMLGNIINVFRTSMGDYSLIGASHYLEAGDNLLFWIMFMIILFLTNIIFLNFVIAEAGNSYSIVSEKLTQYQQKAKAQLIDESETMIPDFFQLKRAEWYPKYIVVRQADV